MAAADENQKTPAAAGPFRVLCADPPWSFGDRLSGRRGASAHYHTLSLYDICGFTRPQVSRNAVLFLWRVASQQEEALQVCRAWGFVPKVEIVWRKLTKTGKPWFGMGHYLRAAHETALVATRGRFAPLARNIRTVFDAPVPVDQDGRYRHSAKPEAFYDLVEAFSRGPYAEMFARRVRPGWSCFGNEVPAPE